MNSYLQFNRTYCLVSLLLLIGLSSRAQLKYPTSKKVDQVDDYFGTKINDPYRWMENDTAADTKAWARKEQDFTEAYLAKIPYRESIKKRMQEIINYQRYSNAFMVGDKVFFTSNTGLQNQSVHYIQQGIKGDPQVFIDPNLLSKDGTVSVVVDGASYDKRYMFYHINKNGSDWSTGYIKDIATGKQLPDSITWMRGGGAAWFKDGFYYERYPEPAKGVALTAIPTHSHIYYHKMGDTQDKDQLIYEDPANPNMGLYPQTTEDGKFLFIYKIPGSNGFDVLGKRLDVADSSFKLLFKGFDYQYNIMDNVNDDLYVNTNDGAGNFKVIKASFDHPEKTAWKTIIPEKKEKMENVSLTGGKLIAIYLKDATSRIFQYDLDGKMELEIKLPGIGSAYGFGGYRNDKTVFYNFTSFNAPPSIFAYDIASGKSEIFKQTATKIKLDDYETEQVFYNSKDGTRVPMFLVHKKGIKNDGSHPTLLYAYGGFDISMSPGFNPTAYPLMDNNGIYAVACIRGGGEYGEAWHQGGMLAKKQNVFDDFIAAAEYLIKNKYTVSKKLSIMGGSNGGLLIGAMLTQRPELFQVAIPEVGVMDMLRFQKFTSGVYWTTEYGSSDTASNFPYLYKYSPLQNIKSGVKYPATLVITADHDDRVVPMHSFKFAATLQEKQAGTAPVLIRISINQGHGASGSSLTKSLETIADIYSFMFYNMDIKPVF